MADQLKYKVKREQIIKFFDLDQTDEIEKWFEEKNKDGYSSVQLSFIVEKNIAVFLIGRYENSEDKKTPVYTGQTTVKNGVVFRR